MEAAYAFRVRFRLEPTDVSLEPSTFDTRAYLAAAEPGEDGWLLFRDVCWRGDVNDESYVCDLFTERLGVPVEAVSFAALHLDSAYRERLHAEIATQLDAFNAESVSAVISKYLGSSVIVEDDGSVPG